MLIIQTNNDRETKRVSQTLYNKGLPFEKKGRIFIIDDVTGGKLLKTLIRWHEKYGTEILETQPFFLGQRLDKV